MRRAARVLVSVGFCLLAVVSTDLASAYAQTSPAPSASALSSPSPTPVVVEGGSVSLDATQWTVVCFFLGVLVICAIAALVAAHGRAVRS